MNLKGAKVLVTGGTGFIGGRLVERLVMDHAADVHVLVKNFARTPRIARFPIKMSPGEVTDYDAVSKAIDGCEIVFHCAYGNTGTPEEQRKVTVEGTENVLKAALKQKVKRLVHVSTISVYGKTPDGDLDESAPRRRSRDVYSDSKLKAEELAFKYYRNSGLPVAIIQPTIVYGPYSQPWTINPLRQLKGGRVILVDGGAGLCNAVYVDDVVQALLLAAMREEAIGQAFLISAEEPITWREFYSAYERMLGSVSTISLSLKEIQDMNKRHRKSQTPIGQIKAALQQNPYIIARILQLPALARVYHLGAKVTPNWVQSRVRAALLGTSTVNHTSDIVAKPVLPLTYANAEFFRARTRVRIDKAKTLLGYQPDFHFEQGMRLTEMWARYSNLV
jgi:nucleoside-diphosphate-sugar epimerase